MHNIIILIDVTPFFNFVHCLFFKGLKTLRNKDTCTSSRLIMEDLILADGVQEAQGDEVGVSHEAQEDKIGVIRDEKTVDENQTKQRRQLQKSAINIDPFIFAQHLQEGYGLQECKSSPTRMQAFADAICAIVATIMILPIIHLEIKGDENLYYSFPELLPKVLIFGLSFQTVVQIWSNHARMFDIVQHTDDLIVILNLAQMMAISFLPYAFTLLAQFSNDMFAVGLYAGLFSIIDVLQILFVWHSFSCKEVLKPDVKNHPYCEHIQQMLYWNIGTQLLLCLLAILLGIFSSGAAFVLLILVAFSTFVRWCTKKFYKTYKRCRYGEEDAELVPAEFFTSNRFRAKERLETFSDGVFSIVATLVILDISEKDVPNAEAVTKAGGLVYALQEKGSIFLAYGGTFITVAMLWFIHHSLFHFIRRVNNVMLSFNTFSLLAVGLLPLGFKLASEFGVRIENVKPEDVQLINEMIAIQMNCACIFLSTLFMLCIWIVGLYNQDELLHPQISFGGKSHGHIFAKLAVYPLVTLLVFFISLKKGVFSMVAFFIMQIAVPIIFLLMKFSNMLIEYRISKYSQVNAEEFDNIPSNAVGIL